MAKMNIISKLTTLKLFSPGASTVPWQFCHVCPKLHFNL